MNFLMEKVSRFVQEFGHFARGIFGKNCDLSMFYALCIFLMLLFNVGRFSSNINEC